MSAHGDGGKGSGRRVENTQAVHDNWDRIFGSKQKKEQKTMNNYEEMDPQRSEDIEEQSDEWCCESCGGPMYSQPHWGYGQCDDCGTRQELIDDNYS